MKRWLRALLRRHEPLEFRPARHPVPPQAAEDAPRIRMAHIVRRKP